MKNKCKVLITTCWILLSLCFVIKLLGGNYFKLACDNKNFIMFCGLIDKTPWLKIIFSVCMSLVLDSLVVLAILKQKFYTIPQLIIFCLLITLSSLLSWEHIIAKNIADVIILITTIFYNKKKWYRAGIAVILIIGFEFVSLFTKNIGEIYLDSESYLTTLILQVDTIIMTTLYYLYSNYERKEVK